MMGIWISHPTGNANVRSAAETFHEAGWLEAFHTGLAWPAYPWLPAALQRRGVQLPARLLQLHPRLEPARLLAIRAGLTALTHHETGALCVDRVYNQVDAAVAASLQRAAQQAKLPSLVYAYEDGARATFEVARRLGVTTVYELPIGYWRFARRLFREEAERRPAWAPTLDGLADSPAKLVRKDAELALAQHIVVPSRFVQRTLAECPTCPDAAITVLPYGCPQPLAQPPERTAAGPLRVLFVGGLSQRKGLADLLDAVDLLGSSIQLTLIGRFVGGKCAPLQRALSRHRWLGSQPRSAVLAEMRHHDVLVLPSLFEGLPLVIGEALAQGLPVIATPNAAAEELLVHGQQGYLVPIRDPERIAEHLEQLLLQPELRRHMAAEALKRAASWTWVDYRTRLSTLIGPLLH
jgi:alpha-maltose-1-phosphate synthase